MPISFRLFPLRDLVLFTYVGQISLQASIAAIAACSAAPGHHAGMRQLVDLSGVTGFEKNFPELLKMQARIAEYLVRGGPELIVLFLAPTRVAQEMAQMALKSWDGLDAIIVRIVEDEAQALALLGVREQCLVDLVAAG